VFICPTEGSFQFGPRLGCRTLNRWKKYMGDYAWILILVGWFVLQRFVLPRFGVST
jgi:p-aminobenzoyl-glutamate transporter AbgT